MRALAVTPSRATPGELLRERERENGARVVEREREMERAGVSFGIRATAAH